MIAFYNRFKIETQLVNWLRKYDNEVGDKQNQLDELTKNYEDEKVALADLQVSRTSHFLYKPGILFNYYTKYICNFFNIISVCF